MVSQRTRLHELAAALLSRLIADCAAQGAPRRAEGIALARQLLELDPWREEAHRHLMDFLARSGQRSAAYAQYETCRSVLAAELGIAPSAETTRAYERIRLAESMPAPELPPQPTSFIGREQERARIAALITNPACRLITLLGPGGIGKSRLALQAALDNGAEFLHGVYFVPLTPITSPDLIIPTVARAFKLPLGRQDLKAQLFEYLRDKQILLILDGFEHLRAGGGVVAELLDHAPDVKILVATRERLDSRWEWIVEVKGLPYPKDEGGRMKDESANRSSLIPHPSSFSAVQLFAQCAQRRQPGFALAEEASNVVRVCQFVEGAPLGIEIAAAWVRDLTCSQIAQEIQSSLDFLQSPLRDAPAEHRSMRAVFEHSWNLLSDEEQRAFRGVSVFRGGFDAEAVEAVNSIQYSVNSLVDKSLLRRDPSGRYDMHELVRHYAAEKLRETGEETRVRSQHLNYYLAFAERAEPELRGSQQNAWLERVETEHGNIRAALGWAVEADAETGLKLAETMSQFWMERGHLQEGRRWLEELLRTGGDVSPNVRADALHGAGNLARSQGDHLQALVYLQQALALKRVQGDKSGVAGLLSNLGNTVMELGDLEQARRLHQECLELRRELGDQSLVAASLNNLGVVAKRQGDYRQAQQFLEECRQRKRQLGDKTGMAIALVNLGDLAYGQGDHQSARALHQEGVDIFRELGARRYLAIALCNLGVCAFALGDRKEGRARLEESISVAREQGDKSSLALSLSHLGDITLAEGDAKRAAELHAESLALARHAQDQARMAQALVGLAQVANHRGNAERAIRLFGAADALRAVVGFVLPIPERARCEQSIAATRARLDPGTFEKAWRAGKALSWQQAAEYAMEPS